MHRLLIITLLSVCFICVTPNGFAASTSYEPSCRLVNPETENNTVKLYEKTDLYGNVVGDIPFDESLRLARLDISKNEEWVKLKYQNKTAWAHVQFLDCRPDPKTAESLISDTSAKLMQAIKDNDWNTIGTLVHPFKGVRLVPYGSIGEDEKQVVTAEQLLQGLSSKQKREWGYHPGSGDPIALSVSDYIKQFVRLHEYWKAKKISYNTFTEIPNTARDIMEFYPHSISVEYRITDLDAIAHATTWSNLLLVFEQYQNKWFVVAIVHTSWTV